MKDLLHVFRHQWKYIQRNKWGLYRYCTLCNLLQWHPEWGYKGKFITLER